MSTPAQQLSPPSWPSPRGLWRVVPQLLVLAAALGSAHADEVRVASAVNFSEVCEELGRRFEASSGHTLVVTAGSTGSLFAQIRSGAEFDVFLAADARRPAALEADGRVLARCTYAEGRLALVGLAAGANGEQSLRGGAFRHLAIAKPELAPYGVAAREALQRLGLWAELEPKLVYGESVGQAYQFVRSEGAEIGLVAYAQVLAAGDAGWLVPHSLHKPIRQDAVLLRDREPAREFFAFLQSAEAQALIAAAGYGPDPGPGLPLVDSPSVWPAIRLTLLLALTATAVLLVLGTPLAWWLARGRSRARVLVEAAVALPLVLPPTVLGFYLLVLLGPSGPLGAAWEALGGPRLVFSFGGLLVGSVVYSLPFVVQPLRQSFRAIDPALLEAAATLRASRLDRWWSVVVPLARPGFLTAAVLGFAHTVGEFGVVLMIGGSVPGRTQVLSIAIYDRVERLDYAQAHWLAGGMLTFSFVTLVAVYAFNRHAERVGP